MPESMNHHHFQGDCGAVGWDKESKEASS